MVGMKKYLILLVGVAVILSAAAVFGGAYMLSKAAKLPNEPASFVETVTVEDNLGTLFMEKKFRYPTAAVVVPPSLDKPIRVGIAGQQNELNFGVAPINSSVRKFINLGNSEQLPIKVHILSYGEMAQNINAPQKDFIMESGEEKEIEVAYNCTQIGEFKGEVDVLIRVPRYAPLKYVLSWV